MVIVKAFSGLINSGKDTCCDYIVKHHGYVKVSIATSLKTFAATLLQAHYPRVGITEEMMYDRESKEKKHDFDFRGQPFSIRRYLQYLGTDVCRPLFGQDVWVNMTINHIQDMGYEKVCIADLRFPNEIAAFRKAFDSPDDSIQTFRVHRLELGESEPHASERTDFHVDVNIINDGTVEDLYAILNDHV